MSLKYKVVFALPLLAGLIVTLLAILAGNFIVFYLGLALTIAYSLFLVAKWLGWL